MMESYRISISNAGLQNSGTASARRLDVASPARSKAAFFTFASIAALAILIRLAPLFHRDTAYAFPAAIELPPAQQVTGDAKPWRQFAAHNDCYEYLQLADGITHGCGFARLIAGKCAPAEILRTPGYPLFLSLAPSLGWALAWQAVIGGFACLVLALCVHARWGLKAALFAQLLVAFDLPSFVLANQVMSETLFAALLLMATIPPLLTIRRPVSAPAIATLAGLSVALAVLVRPIGLLLPICIPIPFLFMNGASRRRRMAIAGLAVVLPVLIIFGWSARNYKVAGYPGLSTIGDLNLYFYRAANLVARERKQSLLVTWDEFGARVGVDHERAYDADRQSPDLSLRMKHLAVGILLAHPFEAAVMTLRNAAYLAFSPLRSQLAVVLGTAGQGKGLGLGANRLTWSKAHEVVQQVSASPLLTSLLILQALMIFAVWAGVARALLRCRLASAEYRVWSLYLAGLSILLLVLAAGAEADVRFRVPVVPLLAAVAALGYCGESRQLEEV